MDNGNLENYLVKRIDSDSTYDSLLRFPSYLEIETVNACNARCPMCTIADWERGVKPMTDKLFDKIAAEIIDHSDEVKRVSLYRDGEPLIDKKLPARVAKLKDGGIKDTHISTNVSLLSESKSVDLLHAGLDSIILSIDSLNKKTYEQIRVRLIFEEVLENALNFIALRNKIRPSTRITVRMIRQEANKDEWPDYDAYWSQKLSQVDRVYSKNVYNWGGQLADYQALAPSYEPTLPCVALWSLMCIFCNGDVPLCNIDFNNKYPSGSVATHSIAELWRSKVMNQRRELHLSGNKSGITLCQNCNVWDEPVDTEGVSSQYGELVELNS